LSVHTSSLGASIDKIENRTLCPSCRGNGRIVKPVTIEALVTESARCRVGRSDGFRFCPEPACDVAYFHQETGERFTRADVKVRIGQKATTPPRTVCYCFDHTVEEIEAEVARTGTSSIPDEITEKCRQGLDRCEETNPQGACCLGNVRRALKEAQAKVEQGSPVSATEPRESNEIEEDCCAMSSQEKPKTISRVDAGAVAQVGALASGIVASACCWLPLLLIAIGVSGGALSATFEVWRPVLLPVTFALLGLAFYSSYRKPRVVRSAAGDASGPGERCSTNDSVSNIEACCQPAGAGVSTLKRVNKVMLWVVTVFVLAFAFFPSYVGYVIGGGDTLAARTDVEKTVVAIEGMTCEACAAAIEKEIRSVPGVAAADVSYERREAVVGASILTPGLREAILTAIAKAGDYKGRFTDQVR